MSVDDSLRAGDLASALHQQVQAVKAQPTDHGARARLVQLLVFSGELDRAESHLLTMAQQDPALQMAAALYGNLLAAEEERRRVFAGQGAPNLPPEPPAWLHDRVETVAAACAGRFDDAAAALARARAGAADPSCSIGGRACASVADFDEFLGPVLEVFAGGRYLWVPFSRLRRVQITPPKGPLDLIWSAVDIEEQGGASAKVHVPVLYAGTAGRTDGLVRIGRKTEWEDLGGVGFRGFGQRTLVTDQDHERPWLAITGIEFGVVP